MKTEKELNTDILNITMKIEDKFPELSKYIGEMSVSGMDDFDSKTSAKHLEDYYNSLEILLEKHSLTHL
jgi:hypothetical protein